MRNLFITFIFIFISLYTFSNDTLHATIFYFDHINLENKEVCRFFAGYVIKCKKEPFSDSIKCATDCDIFLDKNFQSVAKRIEYYYATENKELINKYWNK